MLKITLPAASRALAALTLAALLAACQSGPPRVEYATSKPAPLAELPLHYIMGKPHVEVLINGKGPYLLQFDTGAELAITGQAAAELGIGKGREIRLTGNANSPIPAYLGQVDELLLGSLHLHQQEAVVVDGLGLDQPPLGATTLPLIGYIGRNVYHTYPTELDFRQHYLRIYPAGTPILENTDHVQAFEKTPRGMEFAVETSLGTQNVLFDTGVADGLSLSQKLFAYDPAAVYQSRAGVDGAFVQITHRIKQATLFGQPLTQPMVSSRLNAEYRNGNLLGMECMHGMRFRIDWEHRALGIDGTLPASCANPYGKTGLRAYKSNKGFFVWQLHPDGAVSKMRNKDGTYQSYKDQFIHQINGRDAREISTAEFARLNDGPTGSTLAIDAIGAGATRIVLAPIQPMVEASAPDTASAVTSK